VYTLGRGAVHGAAFGLAVACVQTWLQAWELMTSQLAPPVWSLVRGAAFTVGLGAAIGVVCAPVLRVWRDGLGRHRLAVALVWIAGALALAPAVALAALVGPAAGLGLVPLARWLAFKRRWDPVVLGLFVVAAGIVAPAVHTHWCGRTVETQPASMSSPAAPRARSATPG
jgi:hypothetical protein